ncbi:hypothetical protein Tco_0629228 [Tanacetum coccineum]|uniref:Uncharacterized protein n=1 Tax=Tanacetum coccineum TaxID=301880 RepID=A0ABQ4WSJ9_9ASTR
MLIEFVIQNQFFSYTIEEFGQILDIPFNGACSFTDKWSLDDLRYSVPTSGPYQTNPPCHDEIKNYIQEEREGPVTRIRHDKMEFVTKQPRLILPYGMLLTRLFKYVISVNPELSNDHYVLYDCVMYPLAAQQERKTQKDYGTRRVRSSTSSSSAFGQPSSSHPDDDDNDGNDEGTSYMEPFYTRQPEILSPQFHLRDEQRGGIMSIGKGIKNLLKGKKKK